MTLVELLAASVLIIILLLGFFTFLVQGALFTEKNDDSLKGTYLVRNIMEGIKNKEEIRGEKYIERFNTEGYPTVKSVNLNGSFKSNQDLRLRINPHPKENSDIKIFKIEIINQENHIVAETYGYLGVK